MISPFRLAFLLLGAAVIGADLLLVRLARREWKLDRLALGAVAAGHLIVIAYLFVDHIGFPLNLDLMEGTVLEHFRHAAAGEAIYPEPGPAYVPLAYNPLFYFLAVPFSWALGVNLLTLRLVAILGTAVCAAVLFAAVKGRTGSAWWGLLAAGLFAAAYRQMDCYLDTAHSDTWMLATALLGTHVLDRRRTAAGRLAGAALLVASFWFKQHGALFALGGLALLGWRDGARRALPAWLLAALLGPSLYLLGGPPLFGPRFLYFTWRVPSRWTEVSPEAVLRVAGFLGAAYLFLALSAAARTVSELRARRPPDLWTGGWIVALLTGLMGALDAGSSDNVFIPMGAWTILAGVLGLHELAGRPALRRVRALPLALFASFALLVFNPLNLRTSPEAHRSYDDLVAYLDGLGGSVYAPYLGQLPEGYTLHPAAHWVALDDLVRGPGRDPGRGRATVARLLQPALDPPGEAFILANLPLENIPAVSFLDERYELEGDLGDRFRPLRVLPARWNHGWPRYLYRYVPGP